MDTPKQLSVAVFGREAELSLEVLRAVHAHHRLAAVVLSQVRGYQPPKKWQRFLDPLPREKDIQRFAREAGIPFFIMVPEQAAALNDFLRSISAEVGVIAKMAQLLPSETINLFPKGILNLHPSLLPQYRGPIPVFWAIYNEEKRSGLTVHFIDLGEDTGDIVKQVELPLDPEESAEDFAQRYTSVAPALVIEALAELAAGTLLRRPQRSLRCPFRARFLKPGEDPIDWQGWPIERIYRVLRGAAGIVDLLPARGFPHYFCDWSVVSFDRKTVQPLAKEILTRGGRHFLPLKDGRIFLKPHFSWWRIRGGFKELLAQHS